MARKTRRTTKPTKPRKSARGPVIDLEALEVASASKTDKPEPAVEESAEKTSDEVEDQASDPENQDQPNQLDPSEDEPTGTESAPAENGVATTSDGHGKLIAASLAGLLVAGGVGAWIYSNFAPAGTGDAAVQISQLQQQIADARKSGEENAKLLEGLDGALRAIQAKIGEAAAATEAQKQSNDKRASSLQSAITKLQSVLETATSAGEGGAAGQAANTLRIDELSKQLEAAVERAAKSKAQFEASTGGADETAVADLQAKIGSLSQAFETLKAEQAARRSQTTSALGQNFAQLSSAVSSGKPFSDQLDALVAVAPTLAGIAELRTTASSGVVTRATLAAQLEQMAEELDQKKVVAAEDGEQPRGVLSIVTSQLSKVVKIRKVGETYWPETLRGAAAGVQSGELKAMVADLSAKTDAVPAGLADWIAQAKLNLSMENAMQQLSAGVLRQLAAAGHSG